MSDTTGVGDFIFWQGGCILIGRAVAPIPVHSHYAIQIAFGREHGIRFRVSDTDDWTDYGAVVISSRQPHAMDATVVPGTAVILVEPETPEGRALTERFGGEGITSISSEVLAGTNAALFTTWQAHRNSGVTVDAVKNVVRTLAGGVESLVVTDERIIRAIAYIRSHLDRPLTLDEVAGEACLSPSRFRHLFVEQTGTALRPYVLWRRFLLAWEVVIRGESLSTAAHAAGFADAAHLTRTSHRMFGFPPSALQVTVR